MWSVKNINLVELSIITGVVEYLLLLAVQEYTSNEEVTLSEITLIQTYYAAAMVITALIVEVYRDMTMTHISKLAI